VSSLIRRLSVENALWGAPRIHGELLMLGIEVAQSTVAKYMAKRRPGSSGQTLKTFLRNHAAGIAAMDFVVVPTNQLTAAVRLGCPATRTASIALPQRHRSSDSGMDRPADHRDLPVG
jgi:hypothetical protein